MHIAIQIASSVCGSVFSLSGQRTPSDNNCIGPSISLLPLSKGVWSFRFAPICLRVQCGWKQVQTFSRARICRMDAWNHYCGSWWDLSSGD